MIGSSPPTGGGKWPADGDPEAPRALTNWRLMRSAVLASLPPFFLLSMGRYFSVSFLLIQSAGYRRGRLRNGGEYFWVFENFSADAVNFVCMEMAAVAVSSAILCLSWVVTVAASATINFGRRPTVGQLLSMMRGVLREEPSITRTYTTVLLLGYTLSVILAVLVVLLVSGDELSWRVMQLMLCFLALLLFVYFVAVGSVGAGASFQVGEGEGGVEVLWRAAALMEERVLHRFLVFFISVLVIHGFLVFYRAEVAAGALSLGPVLTSAVWTVGACSLFGYAGVLLQV